MLLAGIFHKMIYSGFSLDTLDDEIAIEKFLDYISSMFKQSYLEDPEYNASSTSPKKMKELINLISLEEMFY